jgi:hypothetical protein
MTRRHTDAEIEAAANRLEKLLDELGVAAVVVTQIPPRRIRPEHRGGYPSGSKPVSELRPPPTSITRPVPDPGDQ